MQMFAGVRYESHDNVHSVGPAQQWLSYPTEQHYYLFVYACALLLFLILIHFLRSLNQIYDIMNAYILVMFPFYIAFCNFVL